mgnify:CR=1 FL=1
MVSQKNYEFAQFDPRPVGRGANEVIVYGACDAGLLGIEVTIPQLAEHCELGNLDHHGPNDTVDTQSAVEQAVLAELPSEGATLATVRTDADSVSAMAVLASRLQGRSVNKEIVAAIGRFDRLGPSAGRPTDEVMALARVAADFKRPLAERVAFAQAILAGESDVEDVAALVDARNAEFEAAREASELTLYADGRIAVVVSTHRFATNLGYESAPVVVAFNPEMQVNFRDPGAGTYKKFTICRYDSNVAVDISAALLELGELESGWGGRGDIGGSPQGVSSKLTLEEVIAVVKRHLK